MFLKLLLILLLNSCYVHYVNAQNLIYSEKNKDSDSLIIHEGVLCRSEQCVIYKRDSCLQAIISLSNPVVVARADRDEPWGFFQFPSIGKTVDGTLLVDWQMKDDSHKTYGKLSGRECIPMMSKDGGDTWEPIVEQLNISTSTKLICLGDGSTLELCTPAVKNIRNYTNFPKPVAKRGNTQFYLIENLPEEFQGIFLIRRYEKGFVADTIQARVNDVGYLRYSIGDLMPLVRWGDIKNIDNKMLITGLYPSSYIDNKGNFEANGISFYHSIDSGYSWEICGKITYKPDGIIEVRGDNGFFEPTFEVLADSSLICVMRTGSSSPMYKVFSSDFGRTWTTPIAFTPNGVKPQLMLLKNGVLVLVSGRPGVQIRFSFDGTGKMWSDPLEMIPFMNTDGSFDLNVSCGYASIVEAGYNSFYVVYSDFCTLDSLNQKRKSILFRKITVELK